MVQNFRGCKYPIASVALFSVNTVIVKMHVKDTSAPPLIAELILHCTHFGRGKITQNDDYK